jgi:hypothetical protein
MSQIGTIVLSGLLLLTAFQNCSNDVPSGLLGQASLAVGQCNWAGSKVGNGESITAFAVSSVPNGADCVSESRVCTDGVLSGSFTQPSCTILPAGTGTAKTVMVTSGTTWTVPDDFNPAANVILVVGAGARGESGGNGEASRIVSSSGNGPCYDYYTAGKGGRGGFGGGSGANSSVANVALLPKAVVTIRVGGSGDTYLCNSTASCGSITAASVIVGAKAGNGRNGGLAANGIGSTKASGTNGVGGAEGGDGTSGFLDGGFNGVSNLTGGSGGGGGNGAGGTRIGTSLYGAGGKGGPGGTGGVPAVVFNGDSNSCSDASGQDGQNGNNGGGGVIMITYVP